MLKKFVQNLTFVCVIALLVVGAGTESANAYIDPGTGSLIIQTIIGAIAAVGVTLKLYWHKIKLIFGGRKTDSNSVERSEKSEP